MSDEKPSDETVELFEEIQRLICKNYRQDAERVLDAAIADAIRPHKIIGEQWEGIAGERGERIAELEAEVERLKGGDDPASMIARLDNENAALRKRVEELEKFELMYRLVGDGIYELKEGCEVHGD